MVAVAPVGPRLEGAPKVVPEAVSVIAVSSSWAAGELVSCIVALWALVLALWASVAVDKAGARAVPALPLSPVAPPCCEALGGAGTGSKVSRFSC